MSNRLGVRARLAAASCRFVSALSRAAGRGDGSVIGGRVGMVVEPRLLELLAADRQIVLVTGTNGKTTTTRFVAAALSSADDVATNAYGANMPSGLLSALAHAPNTKRAALEVDEHYLPAVVETVKPEVVVLLNLSRDQMDRTREVSMLAQLWKDTLLKHPEVHVVANVDDPLVTWAAAESPEVTWVGAGQRWTDDSAYCPSCGARLERSTSNGWACTSCELCRPSPAWRLEDGQLVGPDGAIHLNLALPGRVNQGNAAMALAAAELLGVSGPDVVNALSNVRSVAGRYATAPYRGRTLRLILAKNPAGWLESLEMVRSGVPVLLSVNARDPDGADTSWLYDVNFTSLRGRNVVLTGDRRHDVAVRLDTDDVEFTVASSLHEACGYIPEDDVDVVANYTAFQDIRVEVGRVT